ncbi:MAG: response regulator [Acidobacteriaceae bacterium]
MRTALVVDDSRTVRAILSRMLARYGFDVKQAGDGAEAWQQLCQDTKDIALVCADYNMPEMNGMDLLKKIREVPGMQSLPVLMITTETHEDAMNRAFAAGVSEYVMKPFTEEMVTDKLRMLGLLPR